MNTSQFPVRNYNLNTNKAIAQNRSNFDLIQNGQYISPSRVDSSAIYTNWHNPHVNKSKTDTVTLLHVNDSHLKIEPTTRLKTAIDRITDKATANGVGVLKFHSGDYNVGTNAEKLKLKIAILNELGIQCAAIGNHEFDIGVQKFSKSLTDNANFLSLATNLNIKPGSPFENLKKTGKLANSAICNIQGKPYGIIGASPPDLLKRLDAHNIPEGVEVMDQQRTITEIQKEIDKLRSKGINRIILLSHVGYTFDKQIARNTDGLDIILGGHSHTVLDPLEPGVSILNSKKNEPVLIFQNGKNSKYLGVTDTSFNQEGVITDAVSRQEKAYDFPVDLATASLENKILGESSIIGDLTEDQSAYQVKFRESSLGNFITDALRLTTGSDIGIFQSFAIRNSLKKGKITERTIDNLLPFIDSVHVLQFSGQDILDALDHGAQSFIRPNKRPGILQVSGLKYTISPQGKATDVSILNKDGSYSPLDLKKEYTVAMDEFLVKGAEGFTSFQKPLNSIKSYYKTSNTMVKDYIKSLNGKPITMKEEGRINIQCHYVDSNKPPKATLSASSFHNTLDGLPSIRANSVYNFHNNNLQNPPTYSKLI